MNNKIVKFIYISINIVIIKIKAEHVWNQYSWWWNGMKWEQWLILSYLLQNVVLQSSSFEQSGHNKMHKKINYHDFTQYMYLFPFSF